MGRAWNRGPGQKKKRKTEMVAASQIINQVYQQVVFASIRSTARAIIASMERHYVLYGINVVGW